MSQIISFKHKSGNIVIVEKSVGEDDNIIANITTNGRIEYLQNVPEDIRVKIRNLKNKYFK